MKGTLENLKTINDFINLMNGKNELVIHSQEDKIKLSKLLRIENCISIVAVSKRLLELSELDGRFVIVERYEHDSLDLKWVIMRIIPIIPSGKKLEQLLKNFD